MEASEQCSRQWKEQIGGRESWGGKGFVLGPREYQDEDQEERVSGRRMGRQRRKGDGYCSGPTKMEDEGRENRCVRQTRG